MERTMKLSTISQYLKFRDYLENLRSTINKFDGPQRWSRNQPFEDALGNRIVLVSESRDGEEYGIEPGKFYPPSLLITINNKLKKEGKDLPIFHSDYDSLDYHVSYVWSVDYRFIHAIDKLPH